MLYRLAALCAVAPILVAALRAGLHGWVPTGDEAHTVLTARFALSWHPQLVGMFTDAAHWIDTTAHFPGPWQLWWMTPAVRILGPTWGTLASMALLNVLWILLAGWCVKRSFGARTAIFALVFLAMLEWTFGNAVYFSPLPMVMVAPAFAAFLFIAWCVAAGRTVALVPLAVSANFLVLDHLVLTPVVPPIALAALVLWAAGTIRRHRVDVAGRQRLRRSTRRATVGAAVVTIVAWIPPLIEQATSEPGNLRALWRANAARPSLSPMWGRGYEALIGLLATPPSWFRGSRHTNLLVYGTPLSTATLVCASIVLIGLTATLVVVALRRRDRPTLAALAIAVTAFLADWYNLAHPVNPTPLPNAIGYHLAAWPVAMFVTFALGYALVRTLRLTRRPRMAPATSIFGVACAVLLAVLNLPASNITQGTYAATDQMITTARDLDEQIIDGLDGARPVALGRSTFFSNRFTAALAVQLNARGIPFCVNGIPQWEHLPIPGCSHTRPAVTIEFVDMADTDEIPRGARIIARHDPLSRAQRHELDTLTRDLTAALADAPVLTLDAAYVDRIEASISGDVPDDLLTPPFLADPLATPGNRSRFANLMLGAHTFRHRRLPVTIPGMTDADLLRWAELQSTATAYSIVAVAHPG